MDRVNEKEFAKAVDWVRAQLEKETFGDVGFTLTVHQGEIRKISYQLVEKKAVQPVERTGKPPTVASIAPTTVQVDDRKRRKRLVTYSELAEVLGVNRVTLSRYVAERKIPFIRIGRAVRFELEAVLASLRKRAQ